MRLVTSFLKKKLQFTESHMIQVLTFLRTDVPHNKLKVMAIRPEAVPGLKPSTLGYMSKILSESNVELGKTSWTILLIFPTKHLRCCKCMKE